MEAQWSGAISKNPFLSLKVKGAKVGDKVAVSAEDNQGNKFDGEVVIA